MTDIELAKYIKLAYFKAPVLTPDLFNKVIDLIIRLLEKPNNGGSGGQMTAEQIRDALQSLLGANRLNASAIHNLAQNVVFTNPQTGQNVNIIQMVDYLLDLIENSTIQPGPGTGIQFYNDNGEWVKIDWSMIENRPTNTSDFTNDGDGTSRFVTINEIESIVKNAIQQDTGILEGFELSPNTSTLGIMSGQYVINDMASISYIDFLGKVLDISEFDTNKNIAYLAIDKNQQIIIKYSDFTESERRLNAIIGYIEYSNTFDFSRSIRPILQNKFHQFYDLLEAYGIQSLSGNKITSPNGMFLSKSAGTFFGPNINGSNQLAPHRLDSLQNSNLVMKYVHDRISNVILSSDVVLSNVKMVNGMLVTLPANTFGFVKISLTISNTYIAELSSSDFSTIENAKEAISDFHSTLSFSPKILLSFFVVYKAGITDLNSAMSQNEADIININLESINQSITIQQIIDALGYVPENVANKVTTLANPNDTTYPTTKAVADAIQEAIENQPIENERHDFVAQSTIVIDYLISSPVKAFVYIDNKEVLANILYDQINKKVTISMGRNYTGYVMVESLSN